jgi:putative DNA primase/helicase
MDARTIVTAMGGRWCGAYGLVLCPCHAERNPSLKIRDWRKLDGIDLHCFAGCAWLDVKNVFQAMGLLESEPSRWPVAAEARISGTILPLQNDDDTEARIEAALKLWQQSLPLLDTPGERYFVEQRGLHVGQLYLDHALRWHAGAGAVVGLMTDAVTNEPTGAHRTFLHADATKRERKMLGRQGVVRLSPDEEVTMGLGIVEGTEDGLSLLLHDWAPVWCATSAGGIERFPVLGGIEVLTIFADADSAGMKAARACAERWIAADREAPIVHLGIEP